MTEAINPPVPVGKEVSKCCILQWLQKADSCHQGKRYEFFHSGAEETYREILDTPTSFKSIPTIDLADIDSPDLSKRKRIAKEIYDACYCCGFFYVKNHGIPQEIVGQTFGTLKQFFSLDQETKMDAHVQKNPAIRGYEPMLETRLDPRTQGGKPRHFPLTYPALMGDNRHQRGLHNGRLCD